MSVTTNSEGKTVTPLEGMRGNTPVQVPGEKTGIVLTRETSYLGRLTRKKVRSERRRKSPEGKSQRNNGRDDDLEMYHFRGV